MPPADRVRVVPAQVKAHAGHVDAVADAVGMAGRAGATTTPGPEAYGRLCAVVPVLLRILQGAVVVGIGAAQESLNDSAMRLRQAADGYRDADERAAAAVRAAGRVS